MTLGGHVFSRSAPNHLFRGEVGPFAVAIFEDRDERGNVAVSFGPSEGAPLPPGASHVLSYGRAPSLEHAFVLGHAAALAMCRWCAEQAVAS
jgi:hypothetical protein